MASTLVQSQFPLAPAGLVLDQSYSLHTINDLPEHSRSRVRLFADDTAMYLCISNISEANILQEDLCKLEKMEEAWDINFHPLKCQVLHVTRLKTPIPSKYFLHNTELESVSAAKYLGVTKFDYLNWGTHIDNITKKANQTLGLGVCYCSMFCCTLLYVHSSIAIILMGKRELVALLYLSSWCLVMVEWLFLAVPWGCLPFVIVVFPDHTHLLFFLKRNIKLHNQDLKSTAYKTLLRPHLEYASTAWSPHTVTDIYKPESVQRKAARWATRDYQQTSSITTML